MTLLRARDQDGARFQPPRWFAPLVVMVALLADYLSPAARWTAALPLMFMAVLLAFRSRAAALTTLFLSSWIAVPVAAGGAFAYHAVRGTPHVYRVSFAGRTWGDACREVGSSRVVGEWEVELLGSPPTRSEIRTDQVPHSTIEVDQDGWLPRTRANVASAFASLHNQLTALAPLLECRPLTLDDAHPTGWSLSVH